MNSIILHRIKAYLYNNVLTSDNPNDFIARVASERSLNVQDVCNAATTRGGADISAPAMEHAVNLWLKEMAYQLCDGYSINTGYFMASTHIKGVFDSPTEHFNPEKHHILFEFQQGVNLRNELHSVTVELLGVAESSLRILQVTDLKSGSVNDLLTPNRNLRISGTRLKIVGDLPGVGILFRSVSTPSLTYLILPEDIVINNPVELMVVIPELTAGGYQLEVTTQYSSGGRPLKEPKTVVFDKILTVV